MDHLFGFLFPTTPLIDYDTQARFLRERLYVLCYCQLACIMIYSYFVSYEHAFLHLLQFFILYSAYKSMYYYSCIILTVLASIQFIFFASSSSLRVLMPEIIVFVVVCYYFLLIYYAY